MAAFMQADGASPDYPWPLEATGVLSFESAREILLGPATSYPGQPACLRPAACGIVLETERFRAAQVRGPGGCRTA